MSMVGPRVGGPHRPPYSEAGKAMKQKEQRDVERESQRRTRNHDAEIARRANKNAGREHV